MNLWETSSSLKLNFASIVFSATNRLLNMLLPHQQVLVVEFSGNSSRKNLKKWKIEKLSWRYLESNDHRYNNWYYVKII